MLVDVLEEMGQRAVLGKVSMNQHSPEFYIEGTKEGLEAAEEVAVYIKVRVLRFRGSVVDVNGFGEPHNPIGAGGRGKGDAGFGGAPTPPSVSGVFH